MFFLLFFLRIRRPPRSTRTDTLFPYTTLFRSTGAQEPTWHLRRWTGLEPRTQLRCRRDAMNRMIGLVALCLALGACASLRPALDIAMAEYVAIQAKSEERRVGKEGVSTSRTRRSQDQ